MSCDGSLLMIDDVPEMMIAGGVVYMNARSGEKLLRVSMPRDIYHASVNRAIQLLTAPSATVTPLPRARRPR